MAKMIDAIELQRRMCALCNQDYSDEPCEPSDCVFIRAINEMLTLTPPNEPLTLEHLRASPHGKIKDSTLQSICNRANEIACRPPEEEANE